MKFNRFLNVAILLLVVFYGYGWLKQNMSTPTPPPAPLAGEELTMAGAIVPLSAAEFETAVKGKPSFLFIYASWCPYCREQYPDLVTLEKQYGKQVQFIPLSLDKERDALARFLTGKEETLAAPPYLMPKGEYDAYKTLLRSKGGQFEGGIPYMAVFAADGMLAREYRGKVAADVLESALHSVAAQ